MNITYSASAHGLDGLAVEIDIRDHKLIFDEPIDEGGTDLGINPIEAVLGALGACQSIVIAAFADSFDFSYEDVRVDVEGDMDLEGMNGIEGIRPGLTEVRYKTTIKTNEDEAKVVEFLDFVAKTCPVEDTLSGVKCIRVGIDIE